VTCKDFETVIAKGFANSTSAERIAVKRHSDVCAQCRRRVIDRAEKARKALDEKLGPRVNEALLAYVHVLVQTVMDEDMMDQENQS
jgi:hypothetical protein